MEPLRTFAASHVRVFNVAVFGHSAIAKKGDFEIGWCCFPFLGNNWKSRHLARLEAVLKVLTNGLRVAVF